MRITVTTDEALKLLDQRLPGLVPALGAADGTLMVRLDAHHLPGLPGLVRWLVGVVKVELRPVALADGVATVDVDVIAHRLHVERLGRMLLRYLKDRGGPEPLRYVTPRRDEDAVLLDLDVDAATAELVGPVRLRHLEVGEGEVTLEVEVLGEGRGAHRRRSLPE